MSQKKFNEFTASSRALEQMGKDARTERLKESEDFLEELSFAIKKAFYATIHAYMAEQGEAVSKNVIKKILEKDLDVPMIETYQAQTDIQEVLERVGYEQAGQHIRKDEQLLVLHLPRIMWHLPYFHKTTLTPTNSRELSSEMYVRCIDAIWDTARGLTSKHGLEIHRLNPPGTHVSKLEGYSTSG